MFVDRKNQLYSQVYSAEGHVLDSFGTRMLKRAAEITVVTNNWVMVLDYDHKNSTALSCPPV